LAGADPKHSVRDAGAPGVRNDVQRTQLTRVRRLGNDDRDAGDLALAFGDEAHEPRRRLLEPGPKRCEAIVKR
jgi:hypothetical protein